jgi:hypothetical protein
LWRESNRPRIWRGHVREDLLGHHRRLDRLLHGSRGRVDVEVGRVLADTLVAMALCLTGVIAWPDRRWI